MIDVVDVVYGIDVAGPKKTFNTMTLMNIMMHCPPPKLNPSLKTPNSMYTLSSSLQTSNIVLNCPPSKLETPPWPPRVLPRSHHWGRESHLNRFHFPTTKSHIKVDVNQRPKITRPHVFILIWSKEWRLKTRKACKLLIWIYIRVDNFIWNPRNWFRKSLEPHHSDGE